MLDLSMEIKGLCLEFMVADLNNVNNEPNALKVSSSPDIMETQTQNSADITTSTKEQKNHITEDKIQSFINALPEYPLHSHGLINAPKVLADVVESTIGAVFIDSNSSIDTTLEESMSDIPSVNLFSGLGLEGSTTVKAAVFGRLTDGNSPGLSSITVDKSVQFTYEELSTATKFSISNKIGQDGFGAVYYAELRGDV
ncbi:hypothetical protein K7X08_025205 [Anisodus acutangulus]|uniref:RNase III domain-containing protein n=1 Tax=Anisodus acutangulus TaxID=402998 RepID=A0A9Q1RG16_9SOLA|nr:hypothetical protein K7X08_025205 [Anisodus acutangulus]